MITGKFNKLMETFFMAEAGAYTTFTEWEMDKGTFNVKKDIRNILIEKIGKSNIPRVNITTNQEILFRICNRAKIYSRDEVAIPCKFSKNDSDEMTIYFNRELITLFNAKAGDKWYVYFKGDSTIPYIGILSKEKWYDLFEELEQDEMQEPDERGTNELVYSHRIEDLVLNEMTAPKKQKIMKMEQTKVVRSISAEEAARREKNRKIKGNRGEEIAIEIEKRRLSKIGRDDLISKITHVAKSKDGLGYDVISVDVTSSGEEVEIYIETKATAGKIDMPFYVSQREIEVSRQYNDRYYIYRIYNMHEDDNSVDYYRINGAIDINYNLIPTEYIAYRKE